MAKHMKVISVWMVLLLASLPLLLQAQPLPQGDVDSGAQQEAQDLLQEMEQVQQDLLQTQEAAMDNHPELREQADELQNVMLEAMREEGFEPMRSLNRMEQLERQLQSEDADADSRPGLVAELREEQQNLLMAEQAALQNQDVQQARDKFMEDLLDAMRAENSRTDEMIAELKEKNAQLQAMMTARGEP